MSKGNWQHSRWTWPGDTVYTDKHNQSSSSWHLYKGGCYSYPSCLVPHTPNSPLRYYWRSKCHWTRATACASQHFQNPSPTKHKQMQGHCIMFVEMELYLHLLYPDLCTYIPTVLWIQLYFLFQLSLPRELPQLIPDLDWHKQNQAHCIRILLPGNCKDKPLFQSCPGLSVYTTVKDTMHFQ